MFASKTSNLEVVVPEGAMTVDAMKFQAFLGICHVPDSGMPVVSKETQGEQAATALAGAPA